MPENEELKEQEVPEEIEEEEVQEPEIEEPEIEEPEVEEPEEPEEDDKIEIIHNGQVHKITKEKAIELAQKGFDYDVKVGPHARIAKLISQNPKISQMVDSYVRQNLMPKEEPKEKPQEFKVSPLDEYKTPEEWLLDNVKKYTQAQPKPQTTAPVNQTDQIVNALKMYDIDGFNKTYPEMIKRLPQLSVSRYTTIDNALKSNDMSELVRFYNEVKRDMGKPAGKETSNPPFKMSSGKTNANKTPTGENYVWDLPNAKFNDIMRKARGF